MELSQKRVEAISNINRDVAQVFFAGLFLGPIASGSFNIAQIAAGAYLSTMLWICSIAIIKH